MLEITIATEAQEREWTDEAGVRWRFRVRPLPETEVAAQAVPYVQIGTRHCEAILSAEKEGQALPINGKPASDPAVRPLLLAHHALLAQAIGREAEKLGQLVLVERGNSPGAPAS